MAAREAKQQVAVICCDLSKAFDVADRTVLAAKLRHYGVDGPAYKLLTDLMQERYQIVVACGGTVRSDPLQSEMGVAQGSSVSNILFSLLLNDLPNAVTEAELLMYADDVAAVVTADSVDHLEQKLNNVAGQLACWFQENGLVLNLSKTHFIHFVLSGRLTRALVVSANGVSIAQVSSTSFLGIEVDSCLTWENHINKLCGKLGSACFALSRIARVVCVDEVRACYYATVHSVLQYGTELWGRAADWERAFRMQKRAVRVIAKVPQDTSAKSFFKELGILTLPSILVYQVAVYVRMNLELYCKHSKVHSYGTRNCEKIYGVSRTLTKSSKTTHVRQYTINFQSMSQVQLV